jgi:VIT1/CCC1 family predicted Fe2+/Mn2+ transporter
MLRRGIDMPQTPHVEKHFRASDTIRDIIIGMSDGLTVPFALAAGLSGVQNASTVVVVTAGLAEIAAGSISMGLGGYLAARSDSDYYDSERRREEEEVVTKPEAEKEEVRDVFRAYGLPEAQITPIVDALATKPEAWVDFMMRYELSLEKPEKNRALTSALTIAGAYIVGGFIPLSPYILFSNIPTAQNASIIATLTALLVFGYVKGRLTGIHPVRGALQTMLVGGLAAAAAFLIAKLIS